MKEILPESALIGYVLVVAPMMQLPLMATVLCVIIQFGGTWTVFAAVWLFVSFQLAPILAGVNALGPHSSSYAFKLAHVFRVGEDIVIPLAAVKAVLLVGSLVLGSQ